MISAYRIQQCTKCYGDVGFVGGGTPPPSPAFVPVKISGFGSPSATKPGLSLGAVLLQGAQGRLCCVCRVRLYFNSPYLGFSVVYINFLTTRIYRPLENRLTYGDWNH